MRTIRHSVFETNSSSCHSITMETTPRKIMEFNENKRYYFSGLIVGGTAENKYTPDIKIDEGLYTLEELYDFFCQLIAYDSLEHYKGGQIDSRLLQVSSPIPYLYNTDEFDKDIERLKTFIIDNNSIDLFKFAFTGEGKNIFCSQLVLKAFILGVFYAYGLCTSFIMTKDELLGTNITFNQTEWGDSRSSARWGVLNSDHSQIGVQTACPDDSDIDTVYRFDADIRDN